MIGLTNFFFFPLCSTLVYVEGDASISSYQDSNGQTRHGLSVIQRELSIYSKLARRFIHSGFY